jgi:opacity protein-like surface antigen
MARPAPIAWLAAASVLLAAGGAGAQTGPGEPPVKLPAPPEPVMLDVGVRFGGAVRLGDAPAFSITQRGGAVLGVGVGVAPSPRWLVGVAYEHTDIGTERGDGDLASVDLSRSLDSVWATVRLNLYQTEHFAIGVSIGPGLVWQHVDANVIVYGGTAGIPDVFRCEDTAGVGLGLRAGVGAEARLGEGFVLSLDAVADELRLSSDAIGTCAPGAGSTALLGARAGLGWRFDVSRYLR